MIYPTTPHLLRCVAFALDTLVKPDPAGKGALSAATTATHLIRYTSLRIDREASLLADDIEALRGLLTALRAYFAALGAAEAGSSALVAQLDAVLAETSRTPQGRDLPSLAADAGALRESLYRTQQQLQGAMRTRRKDETDYQQARQQIRDYIARQLMDEATLIMPAFENRGPRR